MTSQNSHGAGEKKRSRKVKRLIVALAYIVALLIGGVFLVFPEGAFIVTAIVLASIYDSTFGGDVIVIPIERKNLEVTYKLDGKFLDISGGQISLLDKTNRLVFAKEIPLIQFHCDEDCDVQFWRRKSNPNLVSIRKEERYARSQTMFEINLEDKSVKPSTPVKDACPSDKEMAIWASNMFAVKSRALRDRYMDDYVYMGRATGNGFDLPKVSQPKPTEPTRWRNCESEAKAWHGLSTAPITPKFQKFEVKARWTPGEYFDYEILVWKSGENGGAVIHNSHLDDLPDGTADARMFQFSFYETGKRVVFVSQVQNEITILQQQRNDSFNKIGSDNRLRARCLAPASGSSNGATLAASRYFEGWTWLGSVSGKLTPSPDGRLIGELSVLDPSKDGEVFEAPERVCAELSE